MDDFAFMERLKMDKTEEDSFFDDFHSVVEGIKQPTAPPGGSNDFEDEEDSSGKKDLFRPSEGPSFDLHGDELAYYRDKYSDRSRRNKSVDLRPGSNPFEHDDDGGGGGGGASERRYQSDSTLASIGSNSKESILNTSALYNLLHIMVYCIGRAKKE